MGSSALCLTVDNSSATSINAMPLTAAPCVERPSSCKSLWWHNSTNDGIDCTDSIRDKQLWYLNSLGQLSSTFSNGPSYFYEEDLPYCLATAPAAKPAAVKPPPFANQSFPLQVWAGPLAGGSVAVVLLNTGLQSGNVTVTATWAAIGLPAGTRVKVRDALAHTDLGTAVGSVSAVVGSHDAAALHLTPEKQ